MADGGTVVGRIGLTAHGRDVALACLDRVPPPEYLRSVLGHMEGVLRATLAQVAALPEDAATADIGDQLGRIAYYFEAASLAADRMEAA
jgi:hypothetical protein